LSGHLLEVERWTPSSTVSGFWPLAGEIDIRPLLLALFGRGHTIALPETPRRGLPLIFRSWRPGEELLAGRFSTRHPSGAAIVPDVVLVPLLAFDRRGNRLGYGAGYYDVTLRNLPHARRIGCAFACQQMDAVPVEAHDAPLHAVATELGVITCMAG
jgi:5-formyltetrahydrofolate cyclo-ligase